MLKKEGKGMPSLMVEKRKKKAQEGSWRGYQISEI